MFGLGIYCSRRCRRCVHRGVGPKREDVSAAIVSRKDDSERQMLVHAFPCVYVSCLHSLLRCKATDITAKAHSAANVRNMFPLDLFHASFVLPSEATLSVLAAILECVMEYRNCAKVSLMHSRGNERNVGWREIRASEESKGGEKSRREAKQRYYRMSLIRKVWPSAFVVCRTEEGLYGIWDVLFEQVC